MPSLAWHSNGSFFQRSSYENYVHYFIKSGGPYLYTKEAEHLLFGCQSLSRCWLAECWLLWLTAPSWHHFFFFSGNGYQSLLRSLFKTRMEKPEPASLWMQPGLYFTFFFFFFLFKKYILPTRKHIWHFSTHSWALGELPAAYPCQLRISLAVNSEQWSVNYKLSSFSFLNF